MYKTVRKGDASLQYTILPQTDQFPPGGFPQTSGKPRPRIIKYTMGTLMFLIILSCVATPFLMDQNDHNLFASTVLAVGRVGHNSMIRNMSRSQTKDAIANRSRNRVFSESTTETSRRKEEEETTPIAVVLKDGEDFDITSDSLTTPSTQRPQTTVEPMSVRQSLHSSSPSSTTLSSTSSTTTSSKAPSTSPPVPEGTRTASSAPPSREEKMPRVTLKLKENETIPQMYLKAGIASYKKGNITTSVLAHSLSLERLVFKTPQGTIKPWPPGQEQKWYFTEPALDFQWKEQVPVTVYIVVVGVATLASLAIILMLYVQRKLSKRQRQNVEEPETEGHEEDKSTLLGGETQETEEKE